METQSKQVDISRLNRKDRRAFQKRTKIKVPGRNLPYIQDVHKSWDLYNKLREEELAK